MLLNEGIGEQLFQGVVGAEVKWYATIETHESIGGLVSRSIQTELNARVLLQMCCSSYLHALVSAQRHEL